MGAGGGNRRIITLPSCHLCTWWDTCCPRTLSDSLPAHQARPGLCLSAMFYSNLMVTSSPLAVTVRTSQSAFSHPPSISSPTQVPALSHPKTASLEASSPPGSHLFPMVSQTPWSQEKGPDKGVDISFLQAITKIHTSQGCGTQATQPGVRNTKWLRWFSN